MKKTAWVMSLFRTVHIYLTMLGLIPVLFFAATGLLLNNDQWFANSDPAVREEQGQVPAALVASGPVNEAALIDALRGKFGLAGSAKAEVEDDQVRVAFKRPGGQCDAVVERPGGGVRLTHESRGLLGRLTDLHKGAEAGPHLKWLIDATSILLMIAAVTGIVLWLRLPRRRLVGMIALLAGLVTWVAVYFWLVP